MNDKVLAKKQINQVGLRYALLVFIVFGVQFVASIVLSRFARDWVIENNALLSLILTAVTIDVLGFGTLYLTTRKIPVYKKNNRKLPIGLFLGGFCVIYVFVFAGSFIGNFFQNLLVGTGDSAATMVLMDSDLVLRVLVVAVLAPIFEELIFRKILIDRLLKFGAPIAVFSSALLFGLFHGNFAQFFYAALLGAFFACVYIKTGRIIYSICYHIFINMLTSVVGVVLLGKAQVNPEYEAYLSFYSMFLLFLAVAGVIILIVNFKNYMPDPETELVVDENGVETKKVIDENVTLMKIGDFFKSYGMWLAVIACLAIFAYQTLAMLGM